MRSVLPHDSTERKRIPLATGVLDYFSAALVEVAKVSFAGNEKHNPGQPLHWSRNKSKDHPDCLLRHFVDRGTIDPETGMRASAEMAWRALAILQEEMEAAGAPPSRGSRFPQDEVGRKAYIDAIDRRIQQAENALMRYVYGERRSAWARFKDDVLEIWDLLRHGWK